MYQKINIKIIFNRALNVYIERAYLILCDFIYDKIYLFIWIDIILCIDRHIDRNPRFDIAFVIDSFDGRHSRSMMDESLRLSNSHDKFLLGIDFSSTTTRITLVCYSSGQCIGARIIFIFFYKLP